MGRPSKFSQQVADTLCERLADGESLRTICADEGFPHTATICRWLAIHDEFREQYTRARELQADALFDEILDIADNGVNDWMEKQFGDEKRWVENGEALRRSQLRVDARKWMAAKLQPKKYGDRLEQHVTINEAERWFKEEGSKRREALASGAVNGGLPLLRVNGPENQDQEWSDNAAAS